MTLHYLYNKRFVQANNLHNLSGTDVSIFFTVVSRPLNVFHSLISLSNARILYANFLHSMSMFSTSMSAQGVVFHSSMDVLTQNVVKTNKLSYNVSKVAIGPK